MPFLILYLDQQDHDVESQDVQVNQIPVSSDYAEICEIDATYSHTLTFSSDYNELSFSRSRRDRIEPSLTESHYDTSKNILLKIKESEAEAESKAEAGQNIYSLAKQVMDIEINLQQAEVPDVKDEDAEDKLQQPEVPAV